jgi:septal ring factor EnvC (AmiA/AmiB activator)
LGFNSFGDMLSFFNILLQALSQLFQFESAAAQKSLAHHHQLAQVESKYVDLLQSEDTKHQETLREQQQRYNELESLLKQQITSLSQDIDAFKQALDQSQVDAHEARQAIESVCFEIFFDFQTSHCFSSVFFISGSTTTTRE